MSERNPSQHASAQTRATGTTPPTGGPSGDTAPILVGHGYDLHRLDVLASTTPQGPSKPAPQPAQGRPLRVGGVLLESQTGPVAHSDGDALLHAITDALLGAIAAPDLGSLFPDNDPTNEARDSAQFLAEALRRVRAAGYAPSNVDATVVLERPRLAPHRATIRGHLATLLGLPVGRVNVKGKSHEGLDAIGEGRAIEAHAVVLLTRV